MTILFSCGSRNPQVTEEDLISEGNQHLNARNYEAAISSFEQAANRYPRSSQVKVKLMHAYAGAAGFELSKFSDLLIEIDERLTQLSRETNLLKALGKNALEISQRISEILQKFPTLTAKQTQRLNQAVHVFPGLFADPKFQTPPPALIKEVGFQWGTIRIYRLISNLKTNSTYFVKMIADKCDWSDVAPTCYFENEDFISLFAGTKLIIEDFGVAWLMFLISFPKPQSIANKLTLLLDRLYRELFPGDTFEAGRLAYEEFVEVVTSQDFEKFKKIIFKIFDRLHQI